MSPAVLPERGSFLTRGCGDDGDLRAEVAALLASATTSAGAQLRGAVAAAADDLATAAAASQVGRRARTVWARSSARVA